MREGATYADDNARKLTSLGGLVHSKQCLAELREGPWKRGVDGKGAMEDFSMKNERKWGLFCTWSMCGDFAQILVFLSVL